jgi:hypothetical protein
MKALPQIEKPEEMPDFMQEEWLASAIKELDAANLDPHERAMLEIAVAREVSSHYAADQWAEFVEKRGSETTMRQNIRSIIQKRPEWTDAYISELLDVPVQVVTEERARMK